MRFLPLLLLALFALVDLAANWRWLGMEPVSAQIWQAGWAARLGAGLVLVLLASHVAFQRPFGP